jgi:hypothetical protein
MKNWILSMIAATAVNSGATVLGHGVGNGGGVICIGGKCQTLVEAGLRLTPEYEGVYIPSTETFEALQALIEEGSILPFGIDDQLLRTVLGDMSVFRRVDVIDPGKLAEITSLYKTVASDAGLPLNDSHFRLVAFSSDITAEPAMTYLLPSFFELDANQQASILFHEGLYRGQPSGMLKRVLQFENAFSKITEYNQSRVLPTPDKNEKCKDQPATCIDQIILAFKFGFLSGTDLPGLLLATAIQNSEYAIAPGQVVDEQGYRLRLDKVKLIRLAEFDTRIPYMFSKVESLELLPLQSKYRTPKDISTYTFIKSDLESGKSQVWDCNYTECSLYEIKALDEIPLLLPD